MKAAKMREMTVDELRLQETQLQDQIFRLRFQIAASQAENPAKVHLLRKDLARVKTVLRQKLGPRVPERVGNAAAQVQPAAAAPPPAPARKAEPVKAKARSKAKAAAEGSAPAAGKRAGRATSSREAKGPKQGAKR